jgi:hypothetical protein
VWAGAIAGAVVGGLFGYLYFTERGRRLREDLEPRILELIGEFDRARAAAMKARAAVGESWRGGMDAPSGLV